MEEKGPFHFFKKRGRGERPCVTFVIEIALFFASVKVFNSIHLYSSSTPSTSTPALLNPAILQLYFIHLYSSSTPSTSTPALLHPALLQLYFIHLYSSSTPSTKNLIINICIVLSIINLIKLHTFLSKISCWCSTWPPLC